MMNQLRAYSQRVNASAARVVDSLSTLRGDYGFATAGTTTFAWNVMPSVHAPAICTHGKRYERRPQEMLT